MRYFLCLVAATVCLLGAGAAWTEGNWFLAVFNSAGYVAWMILADPPEDAQ